MSRLRKAARATAVVQLFGWGTTLLSLFAVPLYLQFLGQERYGLLLTSLALLSYLMFADVGLNSSSMILIASAAGRDDRASIAAIFRNSCALACLSAFVVAVLVFPPFFWSKFALWDAILPDNAEFPTLWLAIAASAMVSLLLGPIYNLMIGLQDNSAVAVFQGVGRLAGTLLALFFAWNGFSVGVVYGGNVIAAIAAGLVAACYVRRHYSWIRFRGSYWQSDQITQQIRTGAKSFGGRIGTVLASTAPILAISAVAGAATVPQYSIPLTLLSAPLGVFLSLSALLQPGFGEAMGGGETKWIAETVLKLRRQLLLSLGLLGCGFLLLADRFIGLWTANEILVSHTMLLSVLAISGLHAILSLDRFALTGMNRHRGAAVADLACGGLSILVGGWMTHLWGASSIGLAIVVSSLLTIGWFLPMQLRRCLAGQKVFPETAYWLRWSLVQAVAYSIGWWILSGMVGFPVISQILITGMTTLLIYGCLSYVLLRSDFQFAERLIAAKFIARRNNKIAHEAIPCS